MVRLVIKEKKIKSLVLKHQKFEDLIQKVCKSKSIDNLVVTNLKKKKLQIRDEILKLSA